MTTMILAAFVAVLVLAIAPVISQQSSVLTLLSKAAEKDGARCLDGSPPGYYLRKGTSKNDWVIFLEGGGWCYAEDDCYDRSKSDLGSSNGWAKTSYYNNGFLSDDKTINPDFYNWNSVFVPYCDGISFAGNRNEPVEYNGNKLYFRGHRILTAVIESLLDSGLDQAERVILSGCSAGGLAVYYHLDYVRSLIPSSVDLKGLSDAGYFVDVTNIDGKVPWEQAYEHALKMHNTSSGTNQKCINDHRGNGSACLSAVVCYPYISTPLFSLNSQYDTWQLQNYLQVNCMPPNCDAEQMKAIQNFREQFLKQAKPIIQSKQNGAFLDSCLAHCQSRDNGSWSTVVVEKQSASTTFGNWYFNRNNKTKEIDCAYPCNESC